VAPTIITTTCLRPGLLDSPERGAICRLPWVFLSHTMANLTPALRGRGFRCDDGLVAKLLCIFRGGT
jgi:hypothetical protein